MPVVVTDTELQGLLGSGKAVVADFYADWCAPCRALSPEIEELSSRLGGEVAFVKVDVDANPDLAVRLGILGVPTVVHFSGTGEEVARSVGAVRADELARRLRLEHPRRSSVAGH
jgi:thioredoxin